MNREKIWLNLIFLFIHISLVNLQITKYQSPCPATFKYEMNQNGDLVGTIGLYSFEENVELNVELSVGNHVNGYNGQIDLAMPRDEVITSIRNGRPIKYRVTFPRWQNIPPKVTKITVNGQEVCTGPPLPLNRWFPVITTVNLQHRFQKIQPLSAPTTFINDNTIKINGNKRDQNEKNNNQEFIDWELLNQLFTTTIRSTTKKTEIFDLVNNPFLNGRVPSPPPPPTIPPRSNKPINCGNPIVPNPLVINGKSVPRGAFPWLAALFSSTGIGVEYKCAGSLISSKHILTAAHCVTKSKTKTQIPPEKFLFILGKLNIENLLIHNGEKMVGAQDIKIHPDYVPLKSDADLAVVILSEIIEFTNFIRPICLWSESNDLDEIVGENGKIVGWGKDENDNPMTAEPKQATVMVVSQEQCLRSLELFKYITSNRTFCAGSQNFTGPCNGDSGSGFIMNRNNRWFLKGVVSVSSYDSVKQTCDLTNYVVFTDVSKFKLWLLSIISD